ncbi:MAG TPA: hypothetical protein VH208_05935 [Myxococcaceae bacterium]|nr:hypothetical protein [Myxococcaceae bacterium]
MIKLCPRCRRTYSGGTVCLSCADEVALLDVADPAVRRAHLRGDGELRSTLRTYYGARSAMLLQFWFILFGLAGGALLVRKAFLGDGGIHWSLVAVGVAWAVALPAAAAFVGARLVHRFSKSCRKKPLCAGELRVVRRSSHSPAA